MQLRTFQNSEGTKRESNFIKKVLAIYLNKKNIHGIIVIAWSFIHQNAFIVYDGKL